MKRGQATIFIIIGLLIVLAVGLVFYFFQGKETTANDAANSQALQSIIPAVTMYTEQCLQQTIEEGILFLGKHGGYYELPDPHDDQLALPYHFYEDKNVLLSPDELQRQLAMYVQHELFFCIKNFVPFREQGYTVRQGDMTVRTELTPSQATVYLHYPVTIDSEGSSISIQEFSAAIPTRLLVIHGMVNIILTQQEQQPDSICISCIVSESIMNHARVEMYRVSDDDIWFSVIDEEGFINDEQFVFDYLNKYQGEYDA